MTKSEIKVPSSGVPHRLNNKLAGQSQVQSSEQETGIWAIGFVHRASHRDAPSPMAGWLPCPLVGDNHSIVRILTVGNALASILFLVPPEDHKESSFLSTFTQDYCSNPHSVCILACFVCA